MSHRPYPNLDRARHQLQRGSSRHRPSTAAAWIDALIAPLKLTEWQRGSLNAALTVNYPKRTGRSAITTAIVDEAVKAGEHVHITGTDGLKCVGGDDSCPLAESAPKVCGFVHDQWLDGVYRARRRCIAKAGHTSGQFAYDHGPWESAEDPGSSTA